MNLTINGETKIIESGPNPITISMIIKELGHHPQLIVIEFNGSIIEPKFWREQIVQDGDKMEIVTIVGGGSYS